MPSAKHKGAQCKFNGDLSNFEFSQWPPVLSCSQLEALTLYATTYALSHGLVYLPELTIRPLAPTSAIHAPLSLFPSPFPRRLFELAQRLQRTYNILYSRISMDNEFLDNVMGEVEGVGKVDEFVGQLWRGWKHLRDEGLVQVSFDIPSFCHLWSKNGLISGFVAFVEVYFLWFLGNVTFPL